MLVQKIEDAVRAACPTIAGVSIGRVNDKSTWRVDFAPGATDQQKAAAATVLASFDVLAAVKDDLCAQVDARAEAERMMAVTPGAGQAQEYDQVALEASAVVSADQNPTAANYRMLATSIGIDVSNTGNEVTDLRAAAALVMARRSASYARQTTIRRARLQAKKAIREATTEDAARAVVSAIAWS